MLRYTLLLLWNTSLLSVNSYSIEKGRVFVSTPVSNYPKRLVEDCMTHLSPALVTLTPKESTDHALQKLLAHGVSSAPVVEDSDQTTPVVVGMVSSFDFLQQEAFEGALLPMEGSAANVERYIQTAQKICGQQVGDVMSRIVLTVGPHTSMRDAAALMTQKRLHRLPVVISDRRLVGVLSSSDVMRDLLHVVENLPPAKEAEEGNGSLKV